VKSRNVSLPKEKTEGKNSLYFNALEPAMIYNIGNPDENLRDINAKTGTNNG
jgi:hypothetical protein